MASPPAKCRKCGHVFADTTFAITGNVRGLSFVGFGTKCPKCGGPAVIGDGVYTNYTTGLNLDRGPASTREMIDALDALIKRAKEDDLSVAEIIGGLSGISPELVKKVIKKSPTAALLIGVMVLLWEALTSGVSVDINKLIDQAWHIEQGQDPNFHDGPVEQPQPRGSAPQQQPLPPQELSPLSRRAKRRMRGRAKTR